MKKILKKVLNKITPSEKELKKMNLAIDNFVSKLEGSIKKKKIKAEVFVGGSSGKGTVVKRKKQDIDIFVRFESVRDIGKLEKIIPVKKKKIHGSRDYFKVSFSGFKFEIVPVLKISKPEHAKNVTDLSYFHVSYVKRKIKDLRGDVMLAKTFCYAQGVYGAESYIRGFSGYALELLIIHYGGFIKMLRGISKIDVKKKKLVIDVERHYKNRKIEDELNESKLVSPIIFIDPTFKERNVLAGLSYETFFRFQKACKKFLKKPSEKFFEKQAIDKKKFNLILNAKTNRQEGDIAGSKLYKFFRLVERKLEKYFLIEKKEFGYDDKKTGTLYFKIKQRKKIIVPGPPITAAENVTKFRKKHKKVFKKGDKTYAIEKPMSIKSFLSDFKKKNQKIMKEMGIINFEMIK